jgi:hypothetical protein
MYNGRIDGALRGVRKICRQQLHTLDERGDRMHPTLPPRPASADSGYCLHAFLNVNYGVIYRGFIGESAGITRRSDKSSIQISEFLAICN